MNSDLEGAQSDVDRLWSAPDALVDLLLASPAEMLLARHLDFVCRPALDPCASLRPFASFVLSRLCPYSTSMQTLSLLGRRCTSLPARRWRTALAADAPHR